MNVISSRPFVTALTSCPLTIDTSDDPPSLILKYLDDNLLNASNAKKLERADIKYVARNILQALEALHRRGYVYTGDSAAL